MRVDASVGRADVFVDANDEDLPADTFEEILGHILDTFKEILGHILMSQREDEACVDQGVVVGTGIGACRCRCRGYIYIYTYRYAYTYP